MGVRKIDGDSESLLFYLMVRPNQTGPRDELQNVCPNSPDNATVVQKRPVHDGVYVINNYKQHKIPERR